MRAPRLIPAAAKQHLPVRARLKLKTLLAPALYIVGGKTNAAREKNPSAGPRGV